MAQYAEDTQGEDTGPAMQAVHKLHQNVEHLHMQLERLERKFKPALRSVPDKPSDSAVSPKPVHCEITDRLEDIGGALDRMATSIGDLITRCEL